MIYLKLEAGSAIGGEIEDIDPVLLAKMVGDLPDRKDTATLAYVTLRGITVKQTHRALEYLVSNDAAYALRSELRQFLGKNDEKPFTEQKFYIGLPELLEQVSAHIAQLEESTRERRAEFVRRNAAPVRRQRGGYRSDKVEAGA
jgi:hypothetical protein